MNYIRMASPLAPPSNSAPPHSVAAVGEDSPSRRKKGRESDRQLRPLGIGPIQVEKLPRGLVDPLVGVRTEVVPLGLEQVGREPGRAVSVVVGQRSAEGRGGDAAL